MGAKEEDGKLDIGWLHSTVWHFIDLVEKKKKHEEKQIHSTSETTKSHHQVSTFTRKPFAVFLWMGVCISVCITLNFTAHV